MLRPHIAKVVLAGAEKDITVSHALHTIASHLSERHNILQRYLDKKLAGQYMKCWLLLREDSVEIRNALTVYYERVTRDFLFASLDLALAQGEANMYKNMLSLLKSYNISEDDLDLDNFYRAYMRHRVSLRKKKEKKKVQRQAKKNRKNQKSLF